MALNLYRRHYENDRCAGKHAPNSQTYESDELRPKWKKCGCAIYASGRIGDNPKFRKNTKRVHWEEARGVAQAWERGAEEPPPPTPTLAPIPANRVTIELAATACLQEYEGNGSALGTLRRYKTVTKMFRKFSADVKEYVYLDQWQPSDVREFRAWWTGCSFRSHNTNIGFLKAFFEFTVENKWIAVNPARFKTRRSKAQKVATAPIQKSPFTDEELKRMLDTCENRYAKTLGRRYRWKGEDLADLILISAYTGLRISDVVTFHISRLTADGDVHIRAIKNGTWIDTWIPEWLQARIRTRAEQHGPYIFGERHTTDPVCLANPWRKRLDDMWKLCGPWTDHPTHHRFRHTFVRILLQNGVSVATVAELIGDTEEMVRKHYAKWVPERQDRMRAVLQDAFRSKPKLVRVK